MEKQPAYKSYVFDKGYRDVGRTFKRTWGATFKPIGRELRRLGGVFSRGKILSGIITFLADLVVFGAITIFLICLNICISLGLICLLLTAAPIVYVGFLIVAFFDWLYRAVKKISNHCDVCQNKFDMPVYKCSGCGVLHTRLMPSKYGIFKRKCQCGKKLPTTFFNGRQKLEAFCPTPGCPGRIDKGGEHSHISIPVIGGMNSGKTCFINMAISQLEKTASSKHGLEFEYAFTANNNYKRTIEDLRNHQLPDKTHEGRLQYYQFYLTPPKTKVKRRIALCDVAGEVYKNSYELDGQIGYRFADAFIVIIDPLSVTEYKKEVEKRFNLSGYKGSPTSIDEILTRIIASLENMYAVSSKSMIKKDVAVVFTKCDIPGLDEIIGNRAVANCMRNRKVSREQASNMVCEEFLAKYGESNFINNLKSKFDSVQYFTCSSLGYNKNEAQYTPDGVEEPVLWVYNKIFG